MQVPERPSSNASWRVVFAVMVWATILVATASAREWSDTSGNFHVEAELVTIRNGKAYLEKDGEKIIAVPLTKLSKKDLEHLTSLSEYQDYFKKNPIPKVAPTSEASKPSKPKESKQKFATIHVEDETTVGEVRRFKDMGWGIDSLAFSPNGRFLAAGKSDRAVMMFDVDTSKQVAFFDDLEGLGQVTCVVFSPDGTKLLTGGYTGRIQIWDVASNGLVTEANRFVGHSKAVKSITVSADGKNVLSGGDEEKARCWTLADAREQFAIDGFSNSVKATFISRGGKQGLATDGELLVLVDMKSGKTIQTMETGHRSSQAVAIAPDGSRIVTQQTYGLRSWQIRTGKEFPLLQDRELQWFATFSPNSRYLLSGGRGKVNLWDLGKHTKIYEFDTAGSSYVQMIACSPDNRHFAAIPGSAGQDLQVFRMPAEVAEK